MTDRGQSYEGTILESQAEIVREFGVSALEAPSHQLEHTIIGKITKPFHQRAQRVCLGSAHISSVFLQTMGHLCIFGLGNDKQSLGKVQQDDRSEIGDLHNAHGALFTATATLKAMLTPTSSVKERNLPTVTDTDWGKKTRS